MSTNYRSLSSITFADLFDGRLERHGIREHIPEDTAERMRCLTDGRNYLWCWDDDEGQLEGLCVYAQLRNAPYWMIDVISQEFCTGIVSEHEPQYWGFQTEEEQAAHHKKMVEESRERFRHDVLKYVHGEPSSMRPGATDERWAEIAKLLIAKDPDLAEDKGRLVDAMNQIYDQLNSVKVTLSE